MRTHPRLLSVGAAAVIAAGAGLAISAAATPAAGDSAGVMAAAEGAILAERGIPNAPLGSMTSLSSVPSLETFHPDKLATVNLDAQSTQLTLARATLSHYFAASALDSELDNVRAVIRGEQTSNVVFGGSGIAGLKFTSVWTDGNSATVHARVEAWAAFAVQRSSGVWAESIPVNQADYTLKLVSDGGSWLVTDMTVEMVAGSGP